MDLNSSLGKICLGENIVEISSDKVEGSGDWNSLEFQDTANSGQKKETKAMVFYRGYRWDIKKRTRSQTNMQQSYAWNMKLKEEKKVVKKELIVALRGEIYFVKFIINPEEDDVELGVIFGRSFLQTEEEEKSNDDWDYLLDFNIDDIPLVLVRKYFRHLYAKGENKVELDGKIVKEEEEVVKRIKGEALKEKDDPGAFIFPIRLEGQVNENSLADTGSDINNMPYRIYEQLGREEMKKVDRGITMINHTQAEAIGILTNVLSQVEVTTLIAKFLILDIPIDRDSPIVVGRGFLRTISGIVNAPERLFSTFDGFCHQTFHAARSDVMRNAESDSDDEEEYKIQRNTF
ncbi:reverse transcriptase domain-containing protein [Tanacetum coccineum]|uniref:Reverse transcriptase domain-containing protein n=1 Tax=Tanacetum coccineum TaxID=301880 RepID=A0ABQ5CLE8_9ASTR